MRLQQAELVLELCGASAFPESEGTAIRLHWWFNTKKYATLIIPQPERFVVWMDALHQLTMQLKSTEGPVAGGYLEKRSTTGWLHRWFKLEGSRLVYYQSPTDISQQVVEGPRGWAELVGAQVDPTTEDPRAFNLRAPAGRSFYLRAPNESIAKRWIDGLRAVGSGTGYIRTASTPTPAAADWRSSTPNGKSTTVHHSSSLASSSSSSFSPRQGYVPSQVIEVVDGKQRIKYVTSTTPIIREKFTHTAADSAAYLASGAVVRNNDNYRSNNNNSTFAETPRKTFGGSGGDDRSDTEPDEDRDSDDASSSQNRPFKILHARQMVFIEGQTSPVEPAPSRSATSSSFTPWFSSSTDRSEDLSHIQATTSAAQFVAAVTGGIAQAAQFQVQSSNTVNGSHITKRNSSSNTPSSIGMGNVAASSEATPSMRLSSLFDRISVSHDVPSAAVAAATTPRSDSPRRVTFSSGRGSDTGVIITDSFPSFDSYPVKLVQPTVSSARLDSPTRFNSPYVLSSVVKNENVSNPVRQIPPPGDRVESRSGTKGVVDSNSNSNNKRREVPLSSPSISDILDKQILPQELISSIATHLRQISSRPQDEDEEERDDSAVASRTLDFSPKVSSSSSSNGIRKRDERVWVRDAPSKREEESSEAPRFMESGLSESRSPHVVPYYATDSLPSSGFAQGPLSSSISQQRSSSPISPSVGWIDRGRSSGGGGGGDKRSSNDVGRSPIGASVVKTESVSPSRYAAAVAAAGVLHTSPPTSLSKNRVEERKVMNNSNSRPMESISQEQWRERELERTKNLQRSFDRDGRGKDDEVSKLRREMEQRDAQIEKLQQALSDILTHADNLKIAGQKSRTERSSTRSSISPNRRSPSPVSSSSRQISPDRVSRSSSKYASSLRREDFDGDNYHYREDDEQDETRNRRRMVSGSSSSSSAAGKRTTTTTRAVEEESKTPSRFSARRELDRERTTRNRNSEVISNADDDGGGGDGRRGRDVGNASPPEDNARNRFTVQGKLVQKRGEASERFKSSLSEIQKTLNHIKKLQSTISVDDDDS